MDKRKLQDNDNNIEHKIKKYTLTYESTDSSDDESDQQSLVKKEHEHQKNLGVHSNGEEITFGNHPIQTELVQKWSEIMANGLKKGAIPDFIKKYPIPINFQNALGPILNPEIAVMQKEKFLKRDYMMKMKQDLIGNLLSCIGRILTNIHNGDRDCEEIYKQLDDAAMIAAGIHFRETDVRRKFGVSALSKAATNAIKVLEPDMYLFGKDCAAVLKAVQAEESICRSAQLPSTSATATGKNMGHAINTTPLKRMSHTPIKNNVHNSNFHQKVQTSNFHHKCNQNVRTPNFSRNFNQKQNKWRGPNKHFNPSNTWSRIPWQTTDTKAETDTPHAKAETDTPHTKAETDTLHTKAETDTPEDTYFPPPWSQL